MYNTSYIIMEEFYIMEEIKRLVYSRELRWNEIMAIAMRLFRDNIKVIAAGMLVIGLPLSILLTLIQGRVLNLMELANQVSAESLVLSPQESVNLIQQMMTNNVLLMAVTVFWKQYSPLVWQRLPNGGWKADVFLPAKLLWKQYHWNLLW